MTFRQHSYRYINTNQLENTVRVQQWEVSQNTGQEKKHKRKLSRHNKHIYVIFMRLQPPKISIPILFIS